MRMAGSPLRAPSLDPRKEDSVKPISSSQAGQPHVSRIVVSAGRLGGIVGILAVILAAGSAWQSHHLDPPVAVALSAGANLGAVLWFCAVAAFHRGHLGRLGLAGATAAMLGIVAIVTLQLLSFSVGTAGGQGQTAMPEAVLRLAFAGTALVFVWGILCLGTISLRAGMLPRGAVVLWMLGMMASVVTSWPQAPLPTVAGVVWSSIAMIRSAGATGSASSSEVHAPDPTRLESRSRVGRLAPLDALRGTIIMLMAIDHASVFVRRWHPFETWDQPLPDYPSLAALLTRLATHPCAPGFFFLMGAGMVLFAQSRRGLGWSEGKIAGRLAARGLLFIVLEQLIVDVATAGNIYPLEFSILSGLGSAMLLGILFLQMRGALQAAIGVVIVMAMQILPGLLLTADLGLLSPIRLLLVPGSVGAAYVLYPPIPWLGLVLLGMAFARLLLRDPAKAYRGAFIVGVASLALFFVIRGLGGFGNLRLPEGHSAVDYLNLVKYPPSLSFILLALGVDLILLFGFSRASKWLAAGGRVLVGLGQGAMYFFLVHWFIYSALGLAWPTPAGLPQTYLAWAIGLLLLVPLCLAFESFKHQTPETSVWRMI